MDTHRVLAVLLGLATLPAVPAAWRFDYPPPATQPVRATIDPNSAPWWELAALPLLGPGKARAIADYRERERPLGSTNPRVPVFTCPQDLTKVSGIGPVTIERIAPYLRFPDTTAPAVP